MSPKKIIKKIKKKVATRKRKKLRTSSPTLVSEHELVKEMKSLSTEIKKIKSLDYLKVFRNPWKFMWFSFLKGLMVGFGSMLGASVLVGFFIFLLAQISLVPFLGDFVEDIIAQISIESPVQIESGNGNGNNGTIFDQYETTKEELENQ